MTEAKEIVWEPAALTSAPPLIRAAGITHVGTVRKHNEDAWLIEPPVFVVADGMGGHLGGDLASQIVIEKFESLGGTPFVTVGDLERVIKASDDAISSLGTNPETAPGSTVIAAGYLAEGAHGYWLIANVGDSRAYVLTPDSFEQVSKDHSVVQEMIDAGQIDEDQARVHPERHIITRALGAIDDVQPEFVLVPASAGTRILLCSDGLTGELTDAEIESILRDGSAPHATVMRLVARAVEAGGHDNVTAVVIDVELASNPTELDITLGHPVVEELEADTIPGRRFLT